MFIIAAGLLCTGSADARYSQLPDTLLDRGDYAVLAAPVADFSAELDRMNLITSKFTATAGDATDAEMADLSAALKKSHLPQDEIERIRTAHAAAREALRQYLVEIEEWEGSHTYFWDDNGRHSGEHEVPPPKFPKIEPSSGLPAEFADYLEGALVWHNPVVTDKTIARQNWERLLARPAAERHFKSTWAAFMLGKSWEKEDLNKAAQYFQQVRDLARQGFADSAGLAAAGLGLEARICLHQEKFERAIELYLEQWAAGDSSAVPSLRVAAKAALHASDEALLGLAKNSRPQRVITAYLVANPNSAAEVSWRGPGNEKDQTQSCVQRWLHASEAAGVKDSESAEKLALAAYQNDEMEAAQRWIKRAPNSPVAQWLQAKLLVRDRKVRAAADLMEQVARLFPTEPRGTNDIKPAAFKDNLPGADRQVLGELGVLRLARGEYSLALDALLKAGFWRDAAYVAERVLTADELKAYVDTHWPRVSDEQIAEEKENYTYQTEVCPAELREKIRFLLARRLTRVIRGNEAREYYPEAYVQQFDVLAQALTDGWNESLPADQRAKALFQAAKVTYENGLNLIGTEVEPDWRLWDCQGEEIATSTLRATNEATKVLIASKDELNRATQHCADPDVRFHYRYQAAFLAWEGAKLMPNNTDETARVLWTAGCWLKARDPQTADIFYKALVRRNRKTALGAEADRRRWFPVLDENGNIIPKRRPTEQSADEPAATLASDPREEESKGMDTAPSEESANRDPSEATPYVELKTASGELLYLAPEGEGAYSYVVRKGDSLANIARTLGELGLPVTLQDIMDANPGVEGWRLRVGQKLMITLPGRSP